jgi:hypothetical protein
MVFKPLSDVHNRHLGTAVKVNTAADDDIADLPGGVFFSAERTDEPAAGLPCLYYKDATDIVRRVRLAGNGRFQFEPLSESGHFGSLGEVLFVPEVDPRAWAAAKDTATKPLPELAAMPANSCFTALGANENPSSRRRGVYRVGNDGMFRRLLKEPGSGLKWSDAIPSDRFGYFGQHLAVTKE